MSERMMKIGPQNKVPLVSRVDRVFQLLGTSMENKKILRHVQRFE